MKSVFAIVAAVALAAPSLSAQSRGRGTGRVAAATPRTVTVRVGVRDPNGNNLDGVRLTLSGDATGEFSTAAAGTSILPNLKEGTYRVRFDKDGFVPLEREFTVRGTAPMVVDVVLTPAPPPAPPPPLVREPMARVLPPAGPPVDVSITEFLDRNFIGGREPLKESILACKPTETVRLLQMREPIAQHAHDDVDEVLYVVAGEGSAHVAEGHTLLRAGSLLVVPRGTPHAFERRGKNPLILLSTLSGAPCKGAGETK